MKINLKAGQKYSFHNLNGDKIYTIKKSKCRHYFISFFDKIKKRHHKFKRTTLKSIQNLIDLIIKARKIRKAKKLVNSQKVEKVSFSTKIKNTFDIFKKNIKRKLKNKKENLLGVSITC